MYICIYIYIYMYVYIYIYIFIYLLIFAFTILSFKVGSTQYQLLKQAASVRDVPPKNSEIPN